MRSATLTILLLIAVQKSVAAEPCDSDSDCKEDQCCVSRGLLYDYRNCENRLDEGYHCVTEEDSYRTLDGNYFFLCPCKDSFVCKPTSYVDLPFFGRITFNERCVSQDNSTETESMTTTETHPSSNEPE